MDDADFAVEQNERDLKTQISAARGVVSSRPGDCACRQCGGENDRAADGYATCSVCWSNNQRDGLSIGLRGADQ